MWGFRPNTLERPVGLKFNDMASNPLALKRLDLQTPKLSSIVTAVGYRCCCGCNGPEDPHDLMQCPLFPLPRPSRGRARHGLWRNHGGQCSTNVSFQRRSRIPSTALSPSEDSDLSSRCRAYPVTNPFQSHVRGKCGLDARGPSAGSV